MVGAVQAAGARPAPLRKVPAGQPTKAGASARTFAPAITGDSLPSGPAARNATFRPAVEGVKAGGGKAAGFTPLAIGQGINEVANIGFIGNLLIMGNAAVKGGQAAAPAVGSLWNAVKSFDLEGIWNAGKSLGSIGLSTAGKSAGFAGALSLVVNGWRMLNNQISVSVAGARVVGDAVAGAAGGFAGAIAGGVGLTLLGALGIAGAPLTIGAALVGMIGYHYGDKMMRQTGVFRTIVQSTYDMIKGMTGRP